MREHRRKLNRKTKEGKARRKNSRKDPGIPTMLPGKETFVAKMQAEREKEKMQRKIALARNDLSGLAAHATARQASHEPKTQGEREVGKFFDNSKRAFYREFRQVVDNADVILEVLDARDPQGSRVPSVEEMVAATGGRKRIVLVLNKIDLVPREVVQRWLCHLRRELPAIAFRSSTSGAAIGGSLGMGECLGADTLVQLLKNYSRSQEIKTSVRVGVIGYPNVGKSSLINSLKRSKVCRVGATAGVTTSSQEIYLDRNITLLDCPGIVFASPRDANETAQLFLRNCLKIEQIEDPMGPVALILSKTAPETLMTIYSIPRFNGGVDEFLSLVAQRMGRLKKGGVPNLEAAAKVVLGDWNQGKIPFYTVPPVFTDSTVTTDAVIVGNWAPEFDIEAIGRMEVDTVLGNIAEMPVVQSRAIIMDYEADQASATLPPLLAKSKDSTDYQVGISTAEMEINPQRNRLQARKLKKVKKETRKASKRANFASSAGTQDEALMIVDDAYDFPRDFPTK